MNNQVSGQTFDESRFFARLVGALAIVTALLYLRVLLFGGFLAVAPMADPGLTAVLALAAVLVIGAIGLAAAWRWELIGGLLAVFCSIAVALLAADLVDSSPLFGALIYASPLAIAGGLFLLHAWRRRQ